MASLSTVAEPFEHVRTGAMQLYTLDPLLDGRWNDLVASHPKASVFHRQGWLEALSKTYGYRPMVVTSSLPGTPLTDGILFCQVKSWITGNRLVSLPFADHCEPLLNENGDSSEFVNWVREECSRRAWKYLELRPLFWEAPAGCAITASRSYWFHALDLTPSLEQVFGGLHKSSIQRRIQRAVRENLEYEAGCSGPLLDDFYKLLMITRRRHQALPQPRAWFRNLIAGMGKDLEIRLVRKDGVPIAALLSLRHRTTVVYKYGCSDEKFHPLAAMPFLFWKLIEESKAAGAAQIDFGRTDLDNHGLTLFKDRLGATRKQLTYFRYPESAQGKGVMAGDLPGVRRLFSVLPDALLPWAGRMVYRHIG